MNPVNDYIKDPHEIETRSFQKIRALSDLDRFDTDQQQVAMRLIHTCGDPSIANNIQLSNDAIESGISAIQNDADILCDVEMVKQGITKRLINNTPRCYLNDERVPSIAEARGETRTMAALSFWEPFIDGSVVLIGNAPTALFRLMEMISNGAARPALIIGIPVGFVGAAESKDALIAFNETTLVPYITVTGYCGGSAMTAAAFNALLRLNKNIRF